VLSFLVNDSLAKGRSGGRSSSGRSSSSFRSSYSTGYSYSSGSYYYSRSGPAGGMWWIPFIVVVGVIMLLILIIFLLMRCLTIHFKTAFMIIFCCKCRNIKSLNEKIIEQQNKKEFDLPPV
jgi:uncharacterized membrane protein